jgi:hypothetical protein
MNVQVPTLSVHAQRHEGGVPTPIIGVGVHRGNAPSAPPEQGHQGFRGLRVNRKGASDDRGFEHSHDEAHPLRKGPHHPDMDQFPLMSSS